MMLMTEEESYLFIRKRKCPFIHYCEDWAHQIRTKCFCHFAQHRIFVNWNIYRQSTYRHGKNCLLGHFYLFFGLCVVHLYVRSPYGRIYTTINEWMCMKRRTVYFGARAMYTRSWKQNWKCNSEYKSIVCDMRPITRMYTAHSHTHTHTTSRHTSAHLNQHPLHWQTFIEEK